MANKFIFKVVSPGTIIPSEAKFCAYLREDNWNDWFKYRTTYDLFAFDESGSRRELGSVKIGQVGQPRDQTHPKLPQSFTRLDDEFFSLGQSNSYYEELGKMSSSLRRAIVRGLRDIVASPKAFNVAWEEDVTQESLTRSISTSTIKGQFRRLFKGMAKLTRYEFSYAPPKDKEGDKLAEPVTFEVRPNSNPPTNIHVLIGRNGVGKTRFLHLLTKRLVDKKASANSGKFSSTDDFDDSSPPFASVVTVSFSAFDDLDLLPERRNETEGMRYFYLGLRRNEPGQPAHGRPKSVTLLTKEFSDSVSVCVVGPRLDRWHRALELLEADPIFAEAEVSSLANAAKKQPLKSRCRTLFSKLSSGHKIVLLTITRLVELVEEKTLILLDEPEAHLHPPLLSAFIRSLSGLLSNRNGVAIIATHSPVVLQETPKDCVWMLRRIGQEAVAERPNGETFGENVGVLTREVFKLEVVQTGFHRLLQEAVDAGGTFDSVVEQFSGQLGAEARAILRSLVNSVPQE